MSAFPLLSMSVRMRLYHQTAQRSSVPSIGCRRSVPSTELDRAVEHDPPSTNIDRTIIRRDIEP